MTVQAGASGTASVREQGFEVAFGDGSERRASRSRDEPIAAGGGSPRANGSRGDPPHRVQRPQSRLTAR